VVGDAAVVVQTAVVYVDVDVVEGGDGASKQLLAEFTEVCTCISGCFARFFFYNRTSPIIHVQNVWSYTDQCCIIPLVV